MLGRHAIVDYYSASNLSDEAGLTKALTDAVIACGATLIKQDIAKFDGSDSGLTGFAVLGESHISFHTWPEYGFAAVDVFTCGNKCDPAKAVEVFTSYFNTDSIDGGMMGRGNFLTLKENNNEIVEEE
jgi:S-adenosylmethionine decarboxylase proenzyme